jgi:hypothetical protein
MSGRTESLTTDDFFVPQCYLLVDVWYRACFVAQPDPSTTPVMRLLRMFVNDFLAVVIVCGVKVVEISRTKVPVRKMINVGAKQSNVASKEFMFGS